MTILDLAKKVKEKTASRSEIRHTTYEEAYGPGFEDMQRRVPDLARLKALIGYKSVCSLDTILDRVIAYERGRGAK